MQIIYFSKLFEFLLINNYLQFSKTILDGKFIFKWKLITFSTEKIFRKMLNKFVS